MNIVDLYVRFAVSPAAADSVNPVDTVIAVDPAVSADPPAAAVVALVVFVSFVMSQPPCELCCKETDAVLR